MSAGSAPVAAVPVVMVAAVRPGAWALCCTAHGTTAYPGAPGVPPILFTDRSWAAWNAMGHAAAHHTRLPAGGVP